MPLKRRHPYDPSTRAKARSRNGCLTCKGRKVKCDETPVTCRNCQRLSLECSWGSTMIRSPSPSRSPISRVDEQLGSRHDVDLLLNAYFQHVHPIQANSFLHRGDLLRDIQEGVAEPLVVKTVCAVAARYLDCDAQHADGGTLAAVWIQDVKSALMLETDRLGIPKLIAALCLVQHEFASGRMASAWIFSSLAVRYAMAMGLNQPGSSEHVPGGEKEMRKRMMWASFAADCMCNGGVKEYVMCPVECMRIGLPSSEYNYALSVPVERDVSLKESQYPGGPVPSASEDGMMARYVRLMALRSETLRYVKNLATDWEQPWEPGSTYNTLLARLRHWQSTLPQELKMTTDNLYARQGSNELGAMILLHMWYDQVHCSLHRFALPGFEESAPPTLLATAPPEWLNNARQLTYTHASAMRRKYSLLHKHFPLYVPASWQLATLAWEAIRNILQYLAVAHPRGLESDSHKAELEAFQDVIHVVAKTIRFFAAVRVKVRDLIKILRRHGYPVESQAWDQAQASSGSRTPARGPILSRLPMFRRHLNHPNLDGHARRRSIDDGPNTTETATLPELPSEPPDSASPTIDYLSWLPTESDTAGLQDQLWNPFNISGLPNFDTIDSLWSAEGVGDETFDQWANLV